MSSFTFICSVRRSVASVLGSQDLISRLDLKTQAPPPPSPLRMSPDGMPTGFLESVGRSVTLLEWYGPGLDLVRCWMTSATIAGNPALTFARVLELWSQ